MKHVIFKMFVSLIFIYFIVTIMKTSDTLEWNDIDKDTLEKIDFDKNTDITSNTSNTLETKLPAVIVVGVKKCGTGAMIEILKMHPMVAGQTYWKVEVPFFAHDELYAKGINYYKVNMFLSTNEWEIWFLLFISYLIV